MITAQQAAILEYLISRPEYSARFDELTSRFGPDSSFRIHSLVSSGSLTRLSDWNRSVRLTSKGLTELDAYRSSLEKAHQQRAEQETQERLRQQSEDKRARQEARRSWVQWAITTILSVLSFFAGAITEELTGFVHWITSLFH